MMFQSVALRKHWPLIIVFALHFHLVSFLGQEKSENANKL